LLCHTPKQQREVIVKCVFETPCLLDLVLNLNDRLTTTTTTTRNGYHACKPTSVHNAVRLLAAKCLHLLLRLLLRVQAQGRISLTGQSERLRQRGHQL
jgi:hypothetical protein